MFSGSVGLPGRADSGGERNAWLSLVEVGSTVGSKIANVFEYCGEASASPTHFPD